MKNNKGFTLIELLVVVAIIGILAAVGTIAYTGYTASAQKNASKTLFSQSVKYLTAEIQKCVLDSGTTALGTSIDCDATTGTTQPTAGNYVSAFVTNSTDKNPHSTGNESATKIDAAYAATANPTVEGQLELYPDDTAKTISIYMLTETGGETLRQTIAVE